MPTFREIITIPYIIVGIIIGMFSLGVLKSLGFKYGEAERIFCNFVDKLETMHIDLVFSALIYIYILIRIFA